MFVTQKLFEAKSDFSKDERYCKKVDTPQYLPSEKKPDISELYSCDKYSKFVRDIKDADISEEEKQFLLFAATRHIVFNYSKIADYYAHSKKEVQALMEESALVIVDFEDAILNGYVELSKEIYDIVNTTDSET